MDNHQKLNDFLYQITLRIGSVWYFLCPQTLKRCRILFLVDNKFLQRQAFKGCIYEIQTKSHESLRNDKLLDIPFGGSKACDQIYRKHFKAHYPGCSTKALPSIN